MDPTINPKTAMYLNIALAVVLGLAGASAMFTDIFGAAIAKTIVASCSIAGVVLSSVNGVLHSLSTRARGPLARYLEPNK